MVAELQVAETQTPKPEVWDLGLGRPGLGVQDIACGSWDIRFSNAYHIHMLQCCFVFPDVCVGLCCLLICPKPRVLNPET
jgi:hypothetical protein